MNDIVRSYHRVIYLDLSLILYLKERDLQSSITNRLLSTQIQIQQRCIKVSRKYLTKNNIIPNV